eukprot:CAMPEP_0172536170 /NCGR_PEP_ID=MMETSP1067-20121228/7974_1 /TAXON_ID=265564 ORGANISM="Thalassiosira punctigera, Strain Tpunct2005C2" /NCGR_SAMPLE_ID=MMETSP1067 /ASSEMBLY_ACC=CAM_ASM_000444 /LENGTH=807 /DNA_ID=CAMNT_0013321197 /DNA_START=113 /DNA_END=2533 /DNA_ORIENTATION=-
MKRNGRSADPPARDGQFSARGHFVGGRNNKASEDPPDINQFSASSNTRIEDPPAVSPPSASSKYYDDGVHYRKSPAPSSKDRQHNEKQQPQHQKRSRDMQCNNVYDPSTIRQDKAKDSDLESSLGGYAVRAGRVKLADQCFRSSGSPRVRSDANATGPTNPWRERNVSSSNYSPANLAVDSPPLNQRAYLKKNSLYLVAIASFMVGTLISRINGPSKLYERKLLDRVDYDKTARYLDGTNTDFLQGSASRGIMDGPGMPDSEVGESQSRYYSKLMEFDISPAQDGEGGNDLLLQELLQLKQRQQQNEALPNSGNDGIVNDSNADAASDGKDGGEVPKVDLELSQVQWMKEKEQQGQQLEKEIDGTSGQLPVTPPIAQDGSNAAAARDDNNGGEVPEVDGEGGEDGLQSSWALNREQRPKTQVDAIQLIKNDGTPDGSNVAAANDDDAREAAVPEVNEKEVKAAPRKTALTDKFVYDPKKTVHYEPQMRVPQEFIDESEPRDPYPLADLSEFKAEKKSTLLPWLEENFSDISQCVTFQCSSDLDLCDNALETNYDGPDSKPPCCTHILRDMLRDFDIAMQNLMLNYFVGFGTLLGLVRGGRVVPWTIDNDITLGNAKVLRLVFEQWNAQATGMLPIYPSVSRKVSRGVPRMCATSNFAGGRLRKWEIPTPIDPESTLPVLFQDRGHPYMDFYFGTDMDHDTWGDEYRRCQHFRNDVFPVKRYSVYGGQFALNFPAEPAALLNRYYGEDWMQPKRDDSGHGEPLMICRVNYGLEDPPVESAPKKIALTDKFVYDPNKPVHYEPQMRVPQ